MRAQQHPSRLRTRVGVLGWVLALVVSTVGLVGAGVAAAGTAVATGAMTPLVDNTTQGNWRGVYGASGHVVVGDTTVLPAGVSVSEPFPAYTFDANPSDVRSLQRDPGPGRVAAGRYATNVTAALTVPAGASYRLAVYALDYNSADARQETVTLKGADGQVLSQVVVSRFSQGRYLAWNIDSSVTVDIQSTGYANGGYSGLFLDPVDAPGPAPDTTAPTVTPHLEGQQTGQGSYAGPVTVTLPADDGAGYGVDHETYSLDGGPTTNYTRPLWVTAPGSHTVTYSAADYAGNTSPPGSLSFTTTAVNEPSTPLRLIGTNDFHGRLTETAATQATLVKQLQTDHPDNLVLGVGDNYHFSGPQSDFTRGEFTLDALGNMGVAASAVGNHEFDNGLGELNRLRTGGCDPKIGCFDHNGDGTPDRWNGATFPYLGANVVDSHTGAPVLPGSTVLTVHGTKVGVIGAVTEDTQTGIGYDLGVRFNPIAPAVNAEAAKLTDRGVKVIIVLIHQGGSADAACNRPGGPIFDINSQLSPAIDVIMSGHYHQAYTCTLPDPLNHPRLVIAGTAFGANLQLADLKISQTTGDVDRFATTSSVVSTAGVAPDPSMAALVAQGVKEADRRGEQVVAHIDGDIVQPRNAKHQVDTTRENPLLNLIADAELAYVNKHTPGGADLSVTYAGLSPGDLTYATRPTLAGGSEPSNGNVTFLQTWLAQLYDFPIQVEKMTGAQIMTLLRQQWADNSPKPPTNLLGVSNTVHYVRDPAGTTIPGHVGQVTIGGAAVNPHKMYRVAVDSILSRGIGGIFPVFADITHKRNTGEPARQALIAYLAQQPVFHVTGLTGRMPTP